MRIPFVWDIMLHLELLTQQCIVTTQKNGICNHTIVKTSKFANSCHVWMWTWMVSWMV